MTRYELEQIRPLRSEIRMHTNSLKKLEHEYDDAHWPDKVQELREIIEDMRRRCVAQLEALEGYIAAIDDDFTRQVLTLRYMEGLTWKAVAASVGGQNNSYNRRMLAYRYIAKTA